MEQPRSALLRQEIQKAAGSPWSPNLAKEVEREVSNQESEGCP